MTQDWKQVVETLKKADDGWGSGGPRPHIQAAIALCERMASGELVEREHALKLAEFGRGQGIAEAREAQPEFAVLRKHQQEARYLQEILDAACVWICEVERLKEIKLMPDIGEPYTFQYQGELPLPEDK